MQNQPPNDEPGATARAEQTIEYASLTEEQQREVADRALEDLERDFALETLVAELQAEEEMFGNGKPR
jgi:hypothetical protein